VLWLEGTRELVPVFPDLVSRAVVGTLPDLEDFRIIERQRGVWHVQLLPLAPQGATARLSEKLIAVTQALGAAPPSLTISELVPQPRAGKQRRVLGMKGGPCVS
jgi:hypothetical protein